MGRSLLILALLFAYGAAGFDGQRPRILDRPLRDLRETAKFAAIEGYGVLTTFPTLRNLQSVESALRRFNRAL